MTQCQRLWSRIQKDLRDNPGAIFTLYVQNLFERQIVRDEFFATIPKNIHIVCEWYQFTIRLKETPATANKFYNWHITELELQQEAECEGS